MYFFKGQCKQEYNVVYYSDSTVSEILILFAVDGNQLHDGIYLILIFDTTLIFKGLEHQK